MLTFRSVPLDEAAPSYHGYLRTVEDGRVGLHLQAQVPEMDALCRGLNDSGAMFRYAEGKWTIKEVIRPLVFIIAGHTAHHFRLLRERYRLPVS